MIVAATASSSKFAIWNREACRFSTSLIPTTKVGNLVIQVPLIIPSQSRIPTRTPRDDPQQILSCTLTFLDGSQLEIPVKEGAGFYRITDIHRGTVHVVQHEVFIADKQT